MGKTSFSGPIRSAAGVSVNDPQDSTKRVSIAAATSSGASTETLSISSEQAVVTEASTPDSTLVVVINGTEYKIALEAV